MDGTWKDHQWKFDKSEHVAKGDENVLKMKPRILYRPVDPLFPLLDFLFVEESSKGSQKVVGVQITFAEKHAKKTLTYKELYQRLGMKESDKLDIYIVPSPKNAQRYAKRSNSQFFTPVPKDKEKYPLKSIEFITVKSEFDPDETKLIV